MNRKRFLFVLQSLVVYDRVWKKYPSRVISHFRSIYGIKEMCTKIMLESIYAMKKIRDTYVLKKIVPIYALLIFL